MNFQVNSFIGSKVINFKILQHFSIENLIKGQENDDVTLELELTLEKNFLLQYI